MLSPMRAYYIYVGLALAGCNGSSGDAPKDAGADAAPSDAAPADAPLDVDPALRAAAQAACAEQSLANCTKLDTCYSPYMTFLYGTRDTCTARLTLSCVPSILAPGSRTTPDDV